MNANAYKLKCTLLFALLSFCMRCWNDISHTVPLSEIESIKIPANKDAFAMTIKLEGYTKCNVQIIVLNNYEKYLTYNFSGNIDTLIRNDWYQEDLSFKLIYQDACEINQVIARVELLTI